MSTTTDNWEQVQAAAKIVLGESIIEFIGQCRSGPQPESQLIAVLHRVQGQFGHLGETQLDAVAQLMQVPAAKVAGVASFYHF
ncbi:MAG TPA: NAD(P)H-dependent oxidoreductase subunit E, partial [Thermoguttaceae bacterium]|nr:NAD(P)H-dependent oxidoreductase subunit E [Thermoguttaceae bacterium]